MLFTNAGIAAVGANLTICSLDLENIQTLRVATPPLGPSPAVSKQIPPTAADATAGGI
jgi:hypothetical protein